MAPPVEVVAHGKKNTVSDKAIKAELKKAKDRGEDLSLLAEYPLSDVSRIIDASIWGMRSLAQRGGVPAKKINGKVWMFSGETVLALRHLKARAESSVPIMDAAQRINVPGNQAEGEDAKRRRRRLYETFYAHVTNDCFEYTGPEGKTVSIKLERDFSGRAFMRERDVKRAERDFQMINRALHPHTAAKIIGIGVDTLLDYRDGNEMKIPLPDGTTFSLKIIYTAMGRYGFLPEDVQKAAETRRRLTLNIVSLYSMSGRLHIHPRTIRTAAKLEEIVIQKRGTDDFLWKKDFNMLRAHFEYLGRDTLSLRWFFKGAHYRREERKRLKPRILNTVVKDVTGRRHFNFQVAGNLLSIRAYPVGTANNYHIERRDIPRLESLIKLLEFEDAGISKYGEEIMQVRVAYAHARANGVPLALLNEIIGKSKTWDKAVAAINKAFMKKAGISKGRPSEGLMERVMRRNAKKDSDKNDTDDGEGQEDEF